jgi:hypothetical protein
MDIFLLVFEDIFDLAYPRLQDSVYHTRNRWNEGREARDFLDALDRQWSAFRDQNDEAKRLHEKRKVGPDDPQGI